MRKYISILCIIICLLMLVSCKEDVEPQPQPTETTDIAQENPLSLLPSYKCRELYPFAKNVYTGKLLSFEHLDGKYHKYYGSNREIIYGYEGTTKLTIEIDGSYKGEYLQGDTVEEIYVSNRYREKAGFWEEGARYMFMLGLDETVEDMEYAEEVEYGCYERVIKIFEQGYQDLTESSTLYQTDYIFQWLFDYDYTYAYFLDSLPDKEIDSNEKLFELADNVYYGEVLESEDVRYSYNGVYGTVSQYTHKIKVRIINVYKGDYKPGDIVEENSIMDFGINRDADQNLIEVPTGFYFTGGQLDIDFEEDILYRDSISIKDSAGERFRITRSVYNSPDFDATLYILYRGKKIYSSYSLDHVNDFENDIVKNFHKIESEYHLNDTHAYLFPWGIIYSLDGRKTFSCVPEDEYSLTCRSDEVFAGIYEELAKQTELSE